MNQIPEPKIRKSKCSYCGDAPVNHTLYYLESLLTVTFTTHMMNVTNRAPAFVGKFVDLLLVGLFKFFCFLHLAYLSKDISKARSFRSRIIWEEAERRGIPMEQLVLFRKPLDLYRATIGGKTIYFESIPMRPEFENLKKNWDDKIILKQEFAKNNIPIPFFIKLPPLGTKSLEKVFEEMPKPLIVKPQVGSRSRHTVTNISTLPQFKEGVRIARQISSYLVLEEHLDGHVCRATLVGGKLAGFYRGSAPSVIGDGKKTVRELILEKDAERQDRVEPVRMGDELFNYIKRQGFTLDEVLPEGKILSLTHRNGRLFGGTTKEMIDELHPSFIPFFEKAIEVTGLPVAGFDCIIPDPTKDAYSQKWGIIECNTLPFIDLHYYALEGKPRNIAGMIWDLWD
jgi:cyanophycin synthetase